jgi:hypothetical protein
MAIRSRNREHDDVDHTACGVLTELLISPAFASNPIFAKSGNFTLVTVYDRGLGSGTFGEAPCGSTGERSLS